MDFLEPKVKTVDFFPTAERVGFAYISALFYVLQNEIYFVIGVFY